MDKYFKQYSQSMHKITQIVVYIVSLSTGDKWCIAFYFVFELSSKVTQFKYVCF